MTNKIDTVICSMSQTTTFADVEDLGETKNALQTIATCVGNANSTVTAGIASAADITSIVEITGIVKNP